MEQLEYWEIASKESDLWTHLRNLTEMDVAGLFWVFEFQKYAGAQVIELMTPASFVVFYQLGYLSINIVQ